MMEPKHKNHAAFHQAVYLTGPTAVGKTDISLAIAEKLGAEIIALDAMTLYRGMDIGTAKPGPAQTDQVRHHLLDLFDPREESSIDRYLDAAEDVLSALAERGKAALFVGGSPLYLKACLRGLSDLPGRDDALRADLERQAAELGVPSLHKRLAAIDQASADKIATTDLRRIVRALEIHTLTGLAPSVLRRSHDRPAPPQVPVIALIRDRQDLYARIDRRVEVMFEQGLVEEAAKLPQPLSRTAGQAVGYSEAFDVLEGRSSLDEAIAKTRLRTRHFAKHQMTWFRRLEEVQGLRIDHMPDQDVVEALMLRIEASRSGHPLTGDPII